MRLLEGRIQTAGESGVDWYYMKGHDIDRSEFATEVNAYFTEDDINYNAEDVVRVWVRNVPSGLGNGHMWIYPAQQGKSGAYPITLIDRDSVQINRLRQGQRV